MDPPPIASQSCSSTRVDPCRARPGPVVCPQSCPLNPPPYPYFAMPHPGRTNNSNGSVAGAPSSHTPPATPGGVAAGMHPQHATTPPGMRPVPTVYRVGGSFDEFRKQAPPNGTSPISQYPNGFSPGSWAQRPPNGVDPRSPWPVTRDGRGSVTPQSYPRVASMQSKSFDSTHEVAASVLLLAAGVARDVQKETRPKEDDDSSKGSEGSSRPLKKRKNVSEIMRSSPSYVSPVSHSSPQALKAGESSQHSTPNLTEVQEKSPVKNAEPEEEWQREIDNFPALLHSLLTDSSVQVIQWLPHGKAWKIVRWEALRKEVLPRYFPTLPLSIDAFLWHVTAWGFEEITQGEDAGAYVHKLFRRGVPNLCKELKFRDGENTFKVSPRNTEKTRVILQVPSLATAASVDSGKAGSEEKKDDDAAVHTSTPTSAAHHQNNWPRGNTLVHETPKSNAWKNYPEQWNNVSQVSPTIPYSPVRIRSTRGAARSAALLSRTPSTESPRTTSFPVSARGRARRVSMPRGNNEESSRMKRKLPMSGRAEEV